MTVATAPVLTACPSWCDRAALGHQPDPWGDESLTAHERQVRVPADFGEVAVMQRATGEEVSQPPTLSVHLGVDELDVEDGERLVATLAAAVEALRAARR